METNKFVYQTFQASEWEIKLKDFITSIDCTDNKIWHRKREYKKINEELVVLGYYVKYRFSENKNISFRLNNDEHGKIDGWIYEYDTLLESVQITIAYYEMEEFITDISLMNDDRKHKNIESRWVGDKIKQSINRVAKRVKKKSDLNYQNIDTLLIGVRHWFVRRIKNEYLEQKINLVKSIESYIQNSNFKQIVLVDSDFVGKGDFLVIHNINMH